MEGGREEEEEEEEEEWLVTFGTVLVMVVSWVTRYFLLLVNHFFYRFSFTVRYSFSGRYPILFLGFRAFYFRF